mmetsp:Transcript_25129/g.63060  ORF Transcript_25129/g.63060 Transcript_25129/m.63060 type:complete len:206 (-) Transcript_25129:235-852(-)
MPEPMHMETTPSFLPVRLSSGRRLAICRPPVQPSGCPRAMAPPFGFTFSMGIWRCSIDMVACEAKASLISKMSMSPTCSPAFSSAAGMAYAGPTPINLGSTPTTAKLLMRARMGKPSSLAALRRAKRTSEAPSETWLAFPAVVEPPGLKLAFSFARPSNVVPARGPSSALTRTFLSVPSFSLTVVSTGMISESKRPCFCAASALA